MGQERGWRRQVRRLAEDPADDPSVDARKRPDVLNGRAFIELVHGRIGQAEVDHRAERDQKAPVRGAAAGRQLRSDPGLRPDAVDNHVEQLAGRPQPSPDSVRGSELADVAARDPSVTIGSVDTRALPAGEVVHGTYTADSPPDPVTGRVRRDDVELYVFWRDGAEVLLTLSGPEGADDVDAWRAVSSSFTWR